MTQILIIDDDETIQFLLNKTLSRSGYEIILASDGKDGLAKAIKFRPAMIICDWLMPEIDGLEVCRQVKAIPQLSTTFFLLLTSRGTVEDRVEGLDAGSDDFLCKPIEMHELLARVRAGLRLHQLSQDLQRQKELLEAELAEAAEYIRSILPEPMRESQITIDFRFIPSRQLGGDSFDYFWLDDEHLVIYLLDVSGHGLRAALPSISVINLLRSRGLYQVNYYQPSQVLNGLNQTFQMTRNNDKYFTIWYGVYNYKKRKLSYANAGHPPGILLFFDDQGQIQKQVFKNTGLPIGMFPEPKFQEIEIKVPRLSSLYLFSDGIYEINIDEDKLLGIHEFINLLYKYQQNNGNNLDYLLQKVKNFNYYPYFNDDLSIMQIDFF